MLTQKLTPAQVELYRQQRYIIIKGFCKSDEVNKLYNAALKDNAMLNNAFDLNDQSGKKNQAITLVHSW
jgi:hypothetical protein